MSEKKLLEPQRRSPYLISSERRSPSNMDVNAKHEENEQNEPAQEALSILN